MKSVVASKSNSDELAASIRETSSVMPTVSVHPGEAVGPVATDTLYPVMLNVALVLSLAVTFPNSSGDIP